jgi:Flp pilus assembly pilin Flp
MRRLPRAGRHFLPDRRCASAIEFALIAPVLVLFFLATIELVNAYRVQSKLNFAAGQLAELIAAQSSVTEGPPLNGGHAGQGGSLGDMCQAAADDMLPYDTTKLAGWLGSTTVNNGGGLGDNWVDDISCPSTSQIGVSYNETNSFHAYETSPNSMFTATGKTGTNVTGYSAIAVKLFYSYNNILPLFLGPTLTFTGVGVARPRSNQVIPCTYSTTSGTTTTTTPCATSY